MLLTALLLLQAAASAVPAPTEPLTTVLGKGDQIYTCGAEDKWTFTAPEATLYLDGQQVGTHGKGPHWTWKDGSTVTGKLLSSTPADHPAQDIPNLILSVAGNSGPQGYLSPVQHITRAETHGGVAPTAGCDAAHRGELRRVPYTAQYTFWLR